jgi:hypothetical protein
MPFQNRVTPSGNLIAVAERGTLMGNRGVLHNDLGEIVRQSQVQRWITCSLTFRDRRRVVMAAHRYTHLFFLDEATALAAGHRPCGECRRADYRRFQHYWAAARALPSVPGAEEMDHCLHDERALVDGHRRTHSQQVSGLPDGVFVAREDEAWVVRGAELLRWTPGGYADRCPLPRGRLLVLTPPTTVEALRAGFRPQLHRSATNA